MNNKINKKWMKSPSLLSHLWCWIKLWTELPTKLSTELWLSLLTRASIWVSSRTFIWLQSSISSILHPGFIQVQISRIKTFFLSLSWLTAFSLWQQSSFLVHSIKAHQGVWWVSYLSSVLPLSDQSLAVRLCKRGFELSTRLLDVDNGLLFS